MTDSREMESPSTVQGASLNKASLETLNTAGGLLRRYRMDREVGINELAAVLKITPAKLEALENDEYDKLPDMVFTRALALSICRLLGKDSEPVLAMFPSASSPKLVRDSDGLNQSFKSVDSHAPTRNHPPSSGLPKTALAIVALVLAAAVGVYFWPQLQGFYTQWFGERDASGIVYSELPSGESVDGAANSAGVAVAAGQALAPGLVSSELQPNFTVNSGNGVHADTDAPVNAVAPLDAPENSDEELESAAQSTHVGGEAASATTNDTSTDSMYAVPLETIRIEALQDVWIQIRDGENAILQQSTLTKGRELAITNPPPLRVQVGRADAVKVTVKGQPFDVHPFARGNVARFEVAP